MKIRKRRRTRFTSWLYSHKGGAKGAAKRLKVSTATVFYWTRGETVPKIEMANKIVRVSKGKIDYRDFYTNLSN